MDFKRLLISLFLLLFSSWVYSLPEHNGNLGIALVHGTKDHRDDAEGGYWKTDFIQSLTQALPNPENYYVVHCDFSKYMWDEDAAGCAADQLLNFIADKN